MSDALAELREKLVRYRGWVAESRLSGARGAGRRGRSGLGGGLAYFRSGAPLEAIGEALHGGHVSQDAARALCHQVGAVDARGDFERCQVSFADALRCGEGAHTTMDRWLTDPHPRTRAPSARAWLDSVGPAARRLALARERASREMLARRYALLRDVGLGAPPPLRAGSGGASVLWLPEDEGLSQATEADPDTAIERGALQGLLAASDDAAAEFLPRLCRGQGGPRWDGVLAALCGWELAHSGARRDRSRRAAAGLRGLGFEEDMGRLLRAAVRPGQLGPSAALFVGSTSGQVQIAHGTIDYGLWSEMMTAEGVAAGLCRGMVSPALSIEARGWTGAGLPGAAHVLGGLWLQLWADRLYLRTVYGLSGRELEATCHHSAIVLLAVVRVAAALGMCGPESLEESERPAEAWAEGLSRALCCEVPEALAALAWPGRETARALAVGRLAGLALHGPLREQFDDDWFRNPRSAPFLRGAAARGARVDARGLCQEQGADFSDAPRRLLELLP